MNLSLRDLPLLLLALAALGPAPALATAITVAEAIERAIATSSTVAESRDRLAAAEIEGERSRALLPSNPYVSASISTSTFVDRAFVELPDGEFGSESLGRTGPAYSLFLQQDVEIAGQRGKRIESAEISERIATLNLEQARGSAAARARNAFATALARREIVQIENEALHWERELAKAVPAAAKSAGVDLRSEASAMRLLRSQRVQQAAQAAYTRALFDLREIIGMEPGEAIEPAGTLDPPAAEGATLDTLVTTAFEQRADLASLRALAEWYEVQLSLARRNVIPTLTLSGYVSHDDGEELYGGGIGFPLPLFHSPGLEVRSAAASLAGAKRDVELAEQRIRQEVQTAYEARQRARDDLLLLRDQMLPRVKAIAAEHDRRFDLGRSGASDIVAAELDTLSVRRDLVEAERHFAATQVALESAIGTPLTESAPVDSEAVAPQAEQRSPEQ